MCERESKAQSTLVGVLVERRPSCVWSGESGERTGGATPRGQQRSNKTMATAMTAPAGAVGEGSSRDGATTADRSLEKLNALENWASIQSSLENKQVCFLFFHRDNQPKRKASEREREAGTEIERDIEKEAFELASVRLACWGSFYASSTENREFPQPDHYTLQNWCICPGSLFITLLGIATLSPAHAISRLPFRHSLFSRCRQVGDLSSLPVIVTELLFSLKDDSRCDIHHRRFNR